MHDHGDWNIITSERQKLRPERLLVRVCEDNVLPHNVTLTETDFAIVPRNPERFETELVHQIVSCRFGQFRTEFELVLSVKREQNFNGLAGDLCSGYSVDRYHRVCYVVVLNGGQSGIISLVWFPGRVAHGRWI